MNRSWSVDDDPARSGLTLMFSRSTAICDASRHCLILSSVSAVCGAFLRSTAQTRSAKCDVPGRQGEGKGGRVEVPVRF